MSVLITGVVPGRTQGFDHRRDALLLDINPSNAVVRGGVVCELPDASVLLAPGSDVLAGAGEFTSLTGFTQSGAGVASIVDRELSIVNDGAPLVTCSGGTTSYIENATTAVDAALTVSDEDDTNLESATVSITTGHQSAEDTLACPSPAGGITPSYNSSTGVLTLTGTATKAQYQSSLRSVTYNNSSNAPNTTSRVITFRVNDGTQNSAPSTKTVSVQAVNDAPVVTLSGSTPNFTEGGSPVAVDDGLTLSDPDANPTFNGFTMQITTNYSTGNDLLNFTNQNGMVGTWFAGSGMLQVSGSGVSLANTQAAMRSVTFSNSSENPTTGNRNVGIYTTDGVTNSNIAHKTVGVTAVNDAPVLAGSGTPLAYTGLDPAAAVDNSVTVVDVDNANIASGYVEVGTGYIEGEDVLDVTEASGITKSWDAPTGRLTLTGSATKANWQSLLRTVTFYTDTTAGDRTINFRINDGAANSNVHSRVIEVATPIVPVELLTEDSLELATEISDPLLTEG